MDGVDDVADIVVGDVGAGGEAYSDFEEDLPIDTPWIGHAVRIDRSIESMHWGLDFNMHQDDIKRKSTKAARNLDTIQRTAYSLFYRRKGRRKKRSDKAKGLAELMRYVSSSITKLLRFLSQNKNFYNFKLKINI